MCAACHLYTLISLEMSRILVRSQLSCQVRSRNVRIVTKSGTLPGAADDLPVVPCLCVLLLHLHRSLMARYSVFSGPSLGCSGRRNKHVRETPSFPLLALSHVLFLPRGLLASTRRPPCDCHCLALPRFGRLWNQVAKAMVLSRCGDMVHCIVRICRHLPHIGHVRQASRRSSTLHSATPAGRRECAHGSGQHAGWGHGESTRVFARAAVLHIRSGAGACCAVARTRDLFSFLSHFFISGFFVP